VVGYGVCDDEEYFYNFIDGLYDGLGAGVSAKDTVRLMQAKGSGYGISRCVARLIVGWARLGRKPKFWDAAGMRSWKWS
jgi:hypothetical protein